jgi:hypothetical protein
MMVAADEIAAAHQARVIAISDRATSRSLSLWRQMDFADLDASWDAVSPLIVAQANAAQAAMVSTSDSYTAKLAGEYDFDAENSRITPQAFVGVDGSGRETSSLLRGAVTTTKEAIGVGLSATQSFEAGAAYLASMLKTALADLGRSADMVSSVGKGFTRYVRVVEPGACSRCVILAGSDRFKPFKRHPACKCTCQAVVEADIPKRYSPSGVFEGMSDQEQDRAFGKAGAQAIRDGADISQVVSARRGASGMGLATELPSKSTVSRMRKTTIGTRPDGTPVQVYATTEGTTVRGQFGREQVGRSGSRRLANDRYSKVNRVRLMPESIIEIAGEDTALRQAFLRDAGYLEYRPKNGFDAGNKWVQEIAEQRESDRIAVNRATLQFGNFTLG